MVKRGHISSTAMVADTKKELEYLNPEVFTKAENLRLTLVEVALLNKLFTNINLSLEIFDKGSPISDCPRFDKEECNSVACNFNPELKLSSKTPITKRHCSEAILNRDTESGYGCYQDNRLAVLDDTVSPKKVYASMRLYRPPSKGLGRIDLNALKNNSLLPKHAISFINKHYVIDKRIKTYPPSYD